MDGITFHSAAESRRYAELKLLAKAGELHDLRLQPAFPLVVMTGAQRWVVLGEYRADFEYCTCQRTPCVRSHLKVEDVKGYSTPLYRWKKKHVEAQYGFEIREIR